MEIVGTVEPWFPALRFTVNRVRWPEIGWPQSLSSLNTNYIWVSRLSSTWMHPRTLEKTCFQYIQSSVKARMVICGSNYKGWSSENTSVTFSTSPQHYWLQYTIRNLYEIYIWVASIPFFVDFVFLVKTWEIYGFHMFNVARYLSIAIPMLEKQLRFSWYPLVI